jgi:fructose transport system permease protein
VLRRPVAGAPPATLTERLPALGTLGPLLALLAACAVFAAQSDRFLTGANLSLVLQQVMVVGVIAIGQTLVILTAGVDLSCGMVMALGGIVMTTLATQLGLPVPLAIAGGIGVTTLFGALNGVLVTAVRLPPFIVTLGTLNIAFAITQLYSRSQTVTGLPEAMSALGGTFRIGGTRVVYGAVLMLALYAIAWYALRHTAAGRHVYAVGGNPEAARLTGIATPRVLLGVYLLAGLLYGVAALLSVARTGVGDPNAGQTENLDAITAVVLGGTSLFGGRGSVVGTLVGALIVGVFRNGLTLIGVSSVYQILVTGLLVILAVATTSSRAGARDDGACLDRVRRRGGPTGRHAGAWPGEALRSRDRARRRRLRAARGRGAGGDRRQRRGKVVADPRAVGRPVPDAGEILLDGRPGALPQAPIDARRAGIETVYQELAVAPGMSIAENLFLGRELRRGGVLGGCSGCSTSRGCGARARRTWRAADRHRLGRPAGGDALGRAAPGRRRGARRGVRAPRRHHGRADGRAGREGERDGARPDPPRARARAAGGADLARHAARLRDRRPDPRRAARPPRSRCSTRTW